MPMPQTMLDRPDQTAPVCLAGWLVSRAVADSLNLGHQLLQLGPFIIAQIGLDGLMDGPRRRSDIS